MSRLGPLLLLSLSLPYLSSCASAPPAQAPTPGGWLALLPPEGTVFAAAEASLVAGLLDEAAERGPGEGGRELQGVLERTRRVYAALQLRPGARPAFWIAALGEFNPGLVACRMGAEPHWQKRRLEKLPEPGLEGGGAESRRAGSRQARTWWENRSQALELAAPRPGLILLSNEGMPRLLGRLQQSLSGRVPGGVPLPAEAAASASASALFLYLPALPAAMGSGGGGDAAATAASAPIREMWLTAAHRPAEEGAFEVELVFALEEAKNPRLLESLFRLLLAAWLRSSGLEDPVGRLKGAKITAAERQVRVGGLVLREEEILRLLGGFLPG